ncbi:hypothetical protein ACFFX0_20725 [Citricoccus parietis]|uniref:Uncharacterized protein n=1 Tax=Citricoccus parietis TaxID=592307 RepID=A0ABV5G3I0_9MICC
MTWLCLRTCRRGPGPLGPGIRGDLGPVSRTRPPRAELRWLACPWSPRSSARAGPWRWRPAPGTLRNCPRPSAS